MGFTTDLDPVEVDNLQLVPLEPYITPEIYKKSVANVIAFSIGRESGQFKGKGVPETYEVRSSKEDACSVWFTGEYVIVQEDGNEIKYPISGTHYLKYDGSKWTIHGFKFIGLHLRGIN